MAPAKVKNTVWDPSSTSPALLPNSPIMLHRFANIISPPSSTNPSSSNPSPASAPTPADSNPPIVYDKVTLNKDELETIFCSKKQKGTSTNNNTAPKQEEIKEVSLLDMRRSNNIGIVLSRLKLTPEGMKDDLMRMDDKLLSREKVVALIKCVPTPDEETLVKGYSGEAPLAPVEQFLLQMIKIPRVGARLECMQFKVGFETSLSEVKQAVDCVALACQALMNDEAFKQLLMIVLKFGNFMNGGSARGGAIGFKINCLLNLSETKSVDSKTTLLHYLVSYMRANMPAVLDKCEVMFRCAEPVSRIVWKEILAQFDQIKAGMAKLETELVHYPPESAKEDQFRPVMTTFVQSKKPLVEKLGHKLKDVDSVFVDTASYYGEEGVAPEDFFSILHDFNTVFMKAQRDNERERVAAAKREAILAQKKKQAEGAAQEPKTPKIDITHNMFKILDGKRARRSSPLASPTTTPNSPTLTPSNSAHSVSKGHFQKSSSFPVKLTPKSPKSPTSNANKLNGIDALTSPWKDSPHSIQNTATQTSSSLLRSPPPSTPAYPITPNSPLIIDHRSAKSPPSSPIITLDTSSLKSPISPSVPPETRASPKIRSPVLENNHEI